MIVYRHFHFSHDVLSLTRALIWFFGTCVFRGSFRYSTAWWDHYFQDFSQSNLKQLTNYCSCILVFEFFVQ
jgi:hypothetical protein